MNIIIGWVGGLVVGCLCALAVIVAFGVEDSATAFVIGLPFGLICPFVGIEVMDR